MLGYPGCFLTFCFWGRFILFCDCRNISTLLKRLIKLKKKRKITMPFNEKDVQVWTVDSLRNYLTSCGVKVAGEDRKADLIRKVLALLCCLLNLPEAPSADEKFEEISQRRTSKLTVGCIKLPFPEELKSSSWMKEVVYLPEITVSNLKDYAQKSLSQKGFIEGMNLHNAKHVSHVEFNNISDCVDYCFIRGKVVPQTRVRESPYRVWVCGNSSTCQILTGECACIAGYGESCKHVFALLHFVEHKVALGLNKTWTSKKQAWQKTVSKKGEKLHPPHATKTSQVSFERPHPEREHTYEKHI